MRCNEHLNLITLTLPPLKISNQTIGVKKHTFPNHAAFHHGCKVTNYKYSH